MKKTIYLLFLLYFVILIGAVTLFYLIYIRNFSSIESVPLQIETTSPRALIYYTKAEVLLNVDPQALESSSTLPEIIQRFAAGTIGKLDINKNKSQIAYEAKNALGAWEIWQDNINDFGKDKIASQDQNELKDYQDFANPKYNNDKTALAFIAQGQASDAIFIFDLEKQTLKKATSLADVKIADFSWNRGAQKLIFCTSNLSKNGCFEVGLETLEEIKLFEAEVKQISWNKTDDVFYLSRPDTPHIYGFSYETQTTSQIDNVSAPKNIISFQIDPEGKKIVYEIAAEQKSDIYLSNLDGTNRIQITTDGQAVKAVFSPDSKEIAFLRQKDGIYVIGTDKTRERKIVVLQDTIDSLAGWK